MLHTAILILAGGIESLFQWMDYACRMQIMLNFDNQCPSKPRLFDMKQIVCSDINLKCYTNFQLCEQRHMKA